MAFVSVVADDVETATFPVIGGARSAYFQGRFVMDPIPAMEAIHRSYGSLVGFSSPIPGLSRRINLHLVDPGLAECVFRQTNDFRPGGVLIKGPKGTAHSRLRDGFFRSHGPKHAHYRKVFSPFFRKQVIDEFGPRILETARDEICRWPTGTTINLPELTARLAKKFAATVMFREFDVPTALRAAQAIEDHARCGFVSPFSFLPLRIPGLPYARTIRKAEAAERAILDWAASRKSLGKDRDLLAAIVNSPTEAGEPANVERITGYVWNIYGAAYDTTTSIMTWILFLIAQHPEVAAELLEELDGTELDDINAILELPVLDRIVKESLRILPAAPFQWRIAMQDTSIGPHHVSKRTGVIVSCYLINRLEALYDEPSRFCPDRWRTLKRSPYEWLTFSAGPRRCTGIWFAYAFLKTAVARFTKEFRLAVVSGAKIDVKVLVTSRPDPGIPAVLHRQDRNFEAVPINGRLAKYVTSLPRS